MGRKEWLEERRKHIGASDAAVIMGLDPSRSPLQVWLSKVHPEMLEPSDAEDFLEFGIDLEPAIERRYVKATSNQVYHPQPQIIVHPDYPEIACTPDGLCDSPEKIVVEYKFERWADGFGDPGTDEIPDKFLVQTAVQMACLPERNRADVALLHGGPPIRVYRAYRDPGLELIVIDRLRAFWADYVVKRHEPPIDASGEWKHYLGRKFAKPNARLLEVEAGSATESAIRELATLKRNMKDEKEAADLRENELKAAIGENEGLICADGTKVTWKVVKEAEVAAFTRKAYRRFEVKEPKK